jgi:hypothetical protein
MFASPLTCQYAAIPRIFSADAADAAFGAAVNAYKVAWTGASYLFHPPSESQDVFEAIRWAICSARRTGTPTLGIGVIPLRRNARFMQLLAHPLVRIITSTEAQSLCLHDYTRDDATPALKEPVIFIAVGNAAGFDQFYDEERVNARLIPAIAAACVTPMPARPYMPRGRLRMRDVRYPRHWRLLDAQCPPSLRTAGAVDLRAVGPPTAPPPDNGHHVRAYPEGACIYTDGSASADGAGCAVYWPMGLDIDALAASHPPAAVAVWRDRGLAYRMRMHLPDDVASAIAELAGLRLALVGLISQCSDNTLPVPGYVTEPDRAHTAHVFTDCLVALHLLRGYLANAQRYEFHALRHALADLASLIREYVEAPNADGTHPRGLHFHKVRAHAGVPGNTTVDAMAKEAATGAETRNADDPGDRPLEDGNMEWTCDTCHITVPDGDEPLAAAAPWRLAKNLGRDLRDHHLHNIRVQRLATQAARPHVEFLAHLDGPHALDPELSNGMWSALRDPALRMVLKCRCNRFYSMVEACRHAGAARSINCPHCHPSSYDADKQFLAVDGWHHRADTCVHRDLHLLRCARANSAARTIARAISRGDDCEHQLLVDAKADPDFPNWQPGHRPHPGACANSPLPAHRDGDDSRDYSSGDSDDVSLSEQSLHGARRPKEDRQYASDSSSAHGDPTWQLPPRRQHSPARRLARRSRQSRTIPWWLLPDCTDTPDIVQIVGVPPGERLHRRDDRTGIRVRILEIAHTRESRLAIVAAQKKAKYASLVARLRGAGYAVELFVVMIGSRGGITASAAGVLASFGLSPDAAKAVLRRLHVEACNWLMCLLSKSRALDNASDAGRILLQSRRRPP